MVEWKRQNFSPFTQSAVPKVKELHTCTSLGHWWVIPEETHILICVFSEEKNYHSSMFYHLKVVYFIKLLWLGKQIDLKAFQNSGKLLYNCGFSYRKSIKAQQLLCWCTNHSLILWFFFIDSWIFPRNIYC